MRNTASTELSAYPQSEKAGLWAVRQRLAAHASTGKRKSRRVAPAALTCQRALPPSAGWPRSGLSRNRNEAGPTPQRPTMDAPGGCAAFGVAGIENGQGFDRPEAEANRYRHKQATVGSEGHRREGTEIARAFEKPAVDERRRRAIKGSRRPRCVGR
jgi:hypothetical protein